GSDITKTGGFVETSGHDLFIKDNAIVDAKEWLLDPDEVTINAPQSGRNDTNEDDEYTTETIYNNNVKYKNKEKHTLTNSTLETILARGSYVNITAKNKINVTSDINLSNGSLTLWSEGQNNKGLEINGNITANGNNGNANLTIYSGGWLDIHSNISLREGDNINITAKGDIAFEKGSNQTIKGQGTITSGNRKGFRFENVSLNGLGSKGLLFTDARTSEGNISNYFNGTLNISGKVNISMTSPRISVYKRNNGRTFWNITTLNVAKGGSFKLSIDSRGNTNSGQYQRNKGLNGITFSGNNTFNVGKNSTVEFHIDSSIIIPGDSSNFALFNGNISVLGGGELILNLMPHLATTQLLV
ncbi:TPA: adhesin, partial [Haemophilus influenzae]